MKNRIDSFSEYRLTIKDKDALDIYVVHIQMNDNYIKEIEEKKTINEELERLGTKKVENLFYTGNSYELLEYVHTGFRYNKMTNYEVTSQRLDDFDGIDGPIAD